MDTGRTWAQEMKNQSPLGSNSISVLLIGDLANREKFYNLIIALSTDDRKQDKSFALNPSTTPFDLTILTTTTPRFINKFKVWLISEKSVVMSTLIPKIIIIFANTLNELATYQNTIKSNKNYRQARIVILSQQALVISKKDIDIRPFPKDQQQAKAILNEIGDRQGISSMIGSAMQKSDPLPLVEAYLFYMEKKEDARALSLFSTLKNMISQDTDVERICFLLKDDPKLAELDRKLSPILNKKNEPILDDYHRQMYEVLVPKLGFKVVNDVIAEYVALDCIREEQRNSSFSQIFTTNRMSLKIKEAEEKKNPLFLVEVYLHYKENDPNKANLVFNKLKDLISTMHNPLSYADQIRAHLKNDPNLKEIENLFSQATLPSPVNLFPSINSTYIPQY